MQTALINLTQVFEADDYAICVIYFLRNNGLVTLGAKFRELPTNILVLVFNLLQILVEKVCGHDEALAKDRDMVLGITSVLQSLLNYPIVNGSLEQSLADFLLCLASLMRRTPRLLVSWFEIIEAFCGAPVLQKKEDPINEFSEEEEEEEQNKKDSKNQKAKSVNSDVQYNREFPMFYLLLEYIHHGGKVGEVSRTALLYLMEVASTYKPITQWVIDSDLGGFMASGLGALYSQLCRAMSKEGSINHSEITFEQMTNEEKEIKLDSDNNSINSNQDLKTFLSYFLFWQDIMGFCNDIDDLADHLVYNFDALFVRQLLYPSIIETTDSEGGYSDVLIEILATILNYLQNNRLSELIVCYFMGQVVENNPIILARSRKRRPNTAESTSSSLSSNSIHQKPLLTLFDIMTTTLGSSDTNKRACTLKLLAILIAKYYPYVINKLIPTTNIITSIDGKGNFSRFPASIHPEEELITVQNMMSQVELDFQKLPEDENNYVEIISLDSNLTRNEIMKRSTALTETLKFFSHFSLNPEVVSNYQREIEEISNLQMKKFTQSRKVQFKTESLSVHRITSDKTKILSRSECQSRNSGADSDNQSLVIHKKNVIEQVINERFSHYFENGFAENLALTQVIIRLGAWGYVDLRGWVLDVLVNNIEGLTKVLVNSKLNEMKEAGIDAPGNNDEINNKSETLDMSQNNFLNANESLNLTSFSDTARSVDGLKTDLSACSDDDDKKSVIHHIYPKTKEPPEEAVPFDKSISIDTLSLTPENENLGSHESLSNFSEFQDDQSLKSLKATKGDPRYPVLSETSTVSLETTTSIKPGEYDGKNRRTSGLGRWALEMSTSPFRGSKKLMVQSLNFLSLSSSSTSKYDNVNETKETTAEKKDEEVIKSEKVDANVEKRLNERSFYEFLHELNALFYVRSQLFGKESH